MRTGARWSTECETRRARTRRRTRSRTRTWSDRRARKGQRREVQAKPIRERAVRWRRLDADGDIVTGDPRGVMGAWQFTTLSALVRQAWDFDLAVV